MSRLDLNAKKRPGPIYSELLKAEQELTGTQQVVVLITENQSRELQDTVRKMAVKGASFLWLGVFYKKRRLVRPEYSWRRLSEMGGGA